jgi:glycosyltransferase involved in cell wall biosynthesis
VSARSHLLLTADAIGGVWQYSLELAAALRPLGYRATLAVLGPPLSPEQAARAATIADLHVVETGLELEWLAGEPSAIVTAERRLAELARDVGADMVQLHSPALVSEGRYPCPVIAMLHSCVASWWAAVREGPMPEDFLWRTALIRQGLNRATVSIAPSAAFAAAAGRIYGVTPLAVHNGRALPCPAAPREDHVFTAGRLWDEGKNVRLLDEAATHIAAPFMAAGPTRSPQGDAVEFQTLHCPGPLDEAALAAHLSTRPVFASAALYEPFGLSVLEAAAAGCALVLSDIPTFRELWDGAAIFADPRDARAFADAINGLIGDAAARREAGERAQARALRYSPSAMANCMASLYARVQNRVAA